MDKLPQQLEQAFNQIGTSMMSDDFACSLMAYTLVLGGSNEQVVIHEGLNAGIQIAQQKLNIMGGEIPRCTELIRSKIIELETMWEDTPFLKDILFSERQERNMCLWYKTERCGKIYQVDEKTNNFCKFIFELSCNKSNKKHRLSIR